MTVWCGFGPCLVDPDPDLDPDPAIFVINLLVATQKLIYSFSFLKVHLQDFSRIKSQKEVTKQ
jgi:hypothetical protein